MSPRAWVARALLDLSGHVGALGPRLTAAAACCADALTRAAERIAPSVECPGCGGAVPSLDLEVVGVCGECAEREAAATYEQGFDNLLAMLRSDCTADAAINVTPYTNRRPMKEPS